MSKTATRDAVARSPARRMSDTRLSRPGLVCEGFGFTKRAFCYTRCSSRELLHERNNYNLYLIAIELHRKKECGSERLSLGARVLSVELLKV